MFRTFRTYERAWLSRVLIMPWKSTRGGTLAVAMDQRRPVQDISELLDDDQQSTTSSRVSTMKRWSYYGNHHASYVGENGYCGNPNGNRSATLDSRIYPVVHRNATGRMTNLTHSYSLSRTRSSISSLQSKTTDGSSWAVVEKVSDHQSDTDYRQWSY